MALWALSCGEGPDITYTETLEDISYDIRFKWNERDESWKCFIGYAGQDAVASFKMTNGFNLLKPYQYLDGVPPGSMLIYDTVNTNGRPTYDETGQDKTYVVYYVDSTGIES